MELYTFYQLSCLFIYAGGEDGRLVPLIAAICGVSAWIVFFLLQAFGLRRMAINRGLKKKWMAFIPFVNIIYIGRLAGECSFFGHKMKRAGLYTMLAQLTVTVFTVLMIAMEAYLYANYGAPNSFGSWTGLKGFAGAVAGFYDQSLYILSIFQLVYEIFLVILMMGLYKKYVPRNYLVLSMVTLFAPVSRYIIVLVIKDRRAIDYDAYMRAQREAYARRQQQYYSRFNQQNPYNSYHGNPYNPGGYGNPYGQQNSQTSTDEEPFGEFSSQNDNNASSADPNGDDFFN